MKINDPLFGEMAYDYQWEKSDLVTLWGRDFVLKVIVQSEDEDTVEISEIQHNAYKEFVAGFPDWSCLGLKKLISYCKDSLDIQVCDETDFWNNNQPIALFFAITGEWGILFDSDYALEDGIALMRSGEEWVVGPQDILI